MRFGVVLRGVKVCYVRRPLGNNKKTSGRKRVIRTRCSKHIWQDDRHTHMCLLVVKHVLNLGIHTHRNQLTTQTHTYTCGTQVRHFICLFRRLLKRQKISVNGGALQQPCHRVCMRASTFTYQRIQKHYEVGFKILKTSSLTHLAVFKFLISAWSLKYQSI